MVSAPRHVVVSWKYVLWIIEEEARPTERAKLPGTDGWTTTAYDFYQSSGISCIRWMPRPQEQKKPTRLASSSSFGEKKRWAMEKMGHVYCLGDGINVARTIEIQCSIFEPNNATFSRCTHLISNSLCEHYGTRTVYLFPISSIL